MAPATNVSVAIDPRLLATFDEKAKLWRIAAGTYRVQLGGASDAIDQTAELTMTARSFPAAWKPR